MEGRGGGVMEGGGGGVMEGGGGDDCCLSVLSSCKLPTSTLSDGDSVDAVIFCQKGFVPTESGLMKGLDESDVRDAPAGTTGTGLIGTAGGLGELSFADIWTVTFITAGSGGFRGGAGRGGGTFPGECLGLSLETMGWSKP